MARERRRGESRRRRRRRRRMILGPSEKNWGVPTNPLTSTAAPFGGAAALAGVKAGVVTGGDV